MKEASTPDKKALRPGETSAVEVLQSASDEALRRTLRRATKHAAAAARHQLVSEPDAPRRIVRAARRAALKAIRHITDVADESEGDCEDASDAAVGKNDRPGSPAEKLTPPLEMERDVEWESAWAEDMPQQTPSDEPEKHLEVILEGANDESGDSGDAESLETCSTDTDRPETGSKGAQRGPRPKKRKAKKTFSVAERAVAMRIHRIHLLCLLASALYLDQLADTTLMQCRALSLIPMEIRQPFELLKESPIEKHASIFYDALICFVLWFASNYRIASIPCDRCRSNQRQQTVGIPRTPQSRLDHAILHGCGGEQELIALATAMLRALCRGVCPDIFMKQEAAMQTDVLERDEMATCRSGQILVRFVACPNLISRKPEGIHLADQWAALPSWRARLAALLTKWYGPGPEPSSEGTKAALVQPPLNRFRPGKPLKVDKSASSVPKSETSATKKQKKDDDPAPAETKIHQNLRATTRSRKQTARVEDNPAPLSAMKTRMNGRGRRDSKSKMEPEQHFESTPTDATAVDALPLQNNDSSQSYRHYQFASGFLTPWRAFSGAARDVYPKSANENRVLGVEPIPLVTSLSYVIRGCWPLADAELYRVPHYWLEIWDPWREQWTHLDPLRCLLDDPLAVTIMPWWTAAERPAPSPLRIETPTISGDARERKLQQRRAKPDSGGRVASGNQVTGVADQQALIRESGWFMEAGSDSNASERESDASSSNSLPAVARRTRRRSQERSERVVSYIFAVAGGYVRDVTRRYVARFQPVLELRSLDGHRYWVEQVLPLLNPYQARQRLDGGYESDRGFSAQQRCWGRLDALEHEEFLIRHESEPIPRSLSALKNHPAFVLEEHLKKYEAIHPKVVIGTIQRLQSNGRIQSFPVYRRRDVHVLHTKERWFRECRIVRPNERPYKIVQSFMSRFRQRREERRRGRQTPASAEAPADANAGPTELFGVWQTDPMPRPKAEHGIVPRCGLRGNIELWTPEHLPLGTTHVDLPFAAMFARRLGFDFVPAMVGFEVRACGFVPAIRGVVVCTEHAEALKDACQAEIRKRRERAEKRSREEALRRWRQLIRTIVAKERLRKRYGGFQVVDTNASFSSHRAHKAASESSGPMQQNPSPAPVTTPAHRVGATEAKHCAGHEHEWVFMNSPSSKDDLGQKQCTFCGLRVTFESLLP
jgi:hypothetical protein